MRKQLRSRIPNEALRHIEAFQRSPGEKIGRLASTLGLKVVERELDQGIDGYIEYCPSEGSKSGYVIVVNTFQSIERKRWTVAHEIGHFLLHSHSSEPDFADGRRYRGDAAGAVFYAELQELEEEREANKFAEDLLVPISALDRAWTQGRRNFDELARLFWVSREIICIRVDSRVRYKRKVGC